MYLYGPVYSRRYGQSLGVDLSKGKVCSFNCRFCQLQQTEHPTVERTDQPCVAEVLNELDTWANAGNSADFITLCGSGEPTLHRGFGRVLEWVKKRPQFNSLLMSNGSLLWMPEVREQAALADVVKVSLHWWDQTSFESVVRPAPSLRHEQILEGYRLFRQAFKGKLDLEVFVIPGFNDSTECIGRIARLARTFAPDSVTLNTAERKPTDATVFPCPPERMAQLRRLFEASTERHAERSQSHLVYSPAAVRAFFAHHPIPLDDLAKQFGVDVQHIRQALESGE